MKGIDPIWIIALGVLVTIEQAIGQGTVALTNVVPAAYAPYVQGWCTMLAFIGTTIMTGLAAWSSNKVGPFVQSLPVPTAAKIAIGFLIIGAALVSGTPRAHAQATAAQTATVTAVLGPLNAQLNSLNNILSGFAQVDLTVATAEATTAGDTQGAACWQAIAKLPIPTIPVGAGLAWFKQLMRNWQAQYTPLNQNCGSVAPLFLKGYNLMMAQIASLNF